MLCALNFCYYHEQLFLLIFIVFFSILCYNLVIFQGGDEILAYLALYRKYRPTNFNDLVGQNEIVNIIKKEILNNKLSHAYLFSGPRGTGKTSTAKIIARMINCSELGADGVPCGVCENCKNFNSNSDIVEIDAASNNGVDEIRELRDKVNLVPSNGKYKVYIIDEVHMLTTQAFNALLKTLEEPPEHVIFILATTEFYKIPITVVSRCQKFQFLKFSISNIYSRLKEISDNESINIEDDALYEIARLSDGGLRDAINMLDQLSSFKNEQILISDVYKLNGLVSYLDFYDLLVCITENRLEGIVEFFDKLDNCGKSFNRFVDDFMEFVNEILIFNTTMEYKSNIQEKNDIIKNLSENFDFEFWYNLLIFLNDLLIKVKNSYFVKILLTAEFIRFSNLNFLKKEPFNNVVVTTNKSFSEIEKNEKITFSLSKEEMERVKKIRINNTFCTASKKKKEKFIEMWKKLMDISLNNSKYICFSGLLNDVDVAVVGDNDIIFIVKYESLMDRLISKIELFENLVLEVSKVGYKIVFLTTDEWEKEKKSYISNLKNGYKYEYVDENNTNCCDLEEEIGHSNDDIEKVVSIFGDSVISYE